MNELKDSNARNLNTVYLRTLIEVAEFGNFSKAAEHLSISQQLVSSHVRSVEERLQVQFFERHNTGVRLAKSGVQLLPYIKQIIMATDTLFARAEHRAEPIRVGEVRSRRMLLQIWQEHRRSHPEHRISFHDLTGDEQLERLHSGEIDVAMHAATRVNPGFRQAILMLDPVKVFHVRPLQEFVFAGANVGYTLSSSRFSSWEKYCKDLAHKVGAHLSPIGHDITMLEAIGQEMIHGDIPPIIALEGMEEYAESASFYFQYFADCQPYYPWGISIRNNEVRPEVIAFFESALTYSEQMGWLDQIRPGINQLLPPTAVKDPRVKWQ